jgi:hypothetical protein
MIHPAKYKSTRKVVEQPVAAQKIVTVLGFGLSYFYRAGFQKAMVIHGRLNMYECAFRTRRRDDPRLVSPEISFIRAQRGRQPSCLRKGKLVLLLLGCALFIGACADDSGTDNTKHRHRHGSGHGREQTETIDRSNSSSPTPAPTPGW